MMKKRNSVKKTAGIICMIAMVAFTGCASNGKREESVGNEMGEDFVESEEKEESVGNEEKEDSVESGKRVDSIESYQEISEGDTAPDFTTETTDGSTFTLSEQNGKVVLLNFWATWCGPCVGEMPAFERLYAEYGDEVAILAVNCMEEETSVEKFLADEGYTFPVAYDTEGTVNRKYPTDGIPYTLVIGKDGTVKNVYLGALDADTQYKEYKSAIDEALTQQQ